MTLEEIRKFREHFEFNDYYKTYQLHEVSIEGIKQFRSIFPSWTTCNFGGSWNDSSKNHYINLFNVFTYSNEGLDNLRWGS